MKITGVTLEVGGQELEFSGTFSGAIKVPDAPVEPPVEPPIEPPVEPPVEPPTGDVPFGDVAALQALGLLPKYRNTEGHVVVNEDVEWGGQGGERAEIGHLPEDHAAFVAGGHDDLLHGILEVAKQKPPSDMDHAHHPNLFWVPFLMTGVVDYIHNMELCHIYEMDWRGRPLGGSYGDKVFGRELAWNIRELFQLAWAEEHGYTNATGYISSLEANRLELMEVMALPRPENETYRILRMNMVYAPSYGFSSWMENFLGMELCNAVRMGFTKWAPIAKWHYEHLERRLANWPLKNCGYGHIAFSNYGPDDLGTGYNEIMAYAATTDWDDVPQYTDVMRADATYVAWPADDLVFLGGHNGTWYDYENTSAGMYQWAVLAEDIDPRAKATAEFILGKKATRGNGDRWDYRHAFELEQS